MKIVVLPGDGIGPETMAVTVDVLQAASVRFGLNLELLHDIAGHESLKKHGATVTPALLEKVKSADGLMLGPMATYDFKDEAKGEINPSKFFRKSLDLFANIRPSRTYTGVKTITGPFRLVRVVRVFRGKKFRPLSPFRPYPPIQPHLPMTLAEVMSALAAKGSESTKRLWLKHGAKEPFFGVKVADLKVLQKNSKATRPSPSSTPTSPSTPVSSNTVRMFLTARRWPRCGLPMPCCW